MCSSQDGPPRRAPGIVISRSPDQHESTIVVPGFWAGFPLAESGSPAWESKTCKPWKAPLLGDKAAIIGTTPESSRREHSQPAPDTWLGLVKGSWHC